MTSLVKALFAPLPQLLFGGKKKPKAPVQALPEASRDVAAEQDAVDEAVRRRKGSAADILTGTRGAEAAAYQTGKLVIGN